MPLLVLMLLRAQPAVREGGRAASSTTCPPRPPRRSCAATWCSCSSTASTWPPPAPSSTPARLTPDELRVVHFAVDDDRGRRARRRRGSSTGLQRVPARAGRLPRPPPHPRRRRVRGPRAGRRRDRGQRPAPRPQVQGHLAPGAARQDRRRRSVRRCRGCAHANVTAVPFHLESLDEPAVALSAITGADRPSRLVEHRTDEVPSPTSGGGSGAVDGRSSRARRRSSTPRGASASRSPAGSDRSGWPRSTTPPRSSSSWSTPPAPSRWCSSVAAAWPGSDVGTRMVVEGTVGIHKARLAIMNPSYQLLP